MRQRGARNIPNKACIPSNLHDWEFEMPHINDARAENLNLRIDKFHHIRGVLGKSAELNCSLCAAAAVVSHLTGNFTTSGDVAAAFPFTGKLHMSYSGVNPNYQHALTMSKQPYRKASPSDIGTINAAQINGIKTFCIDRIPDLQIIIESTSQELAHAKAEMTKMGPEHVFAVLITGHGHWNFAHFMGDSLEFIDYQSDHPSYAGPAYGPDPMLGIRSGTTFYHGATLYLAFWYPSYVGHYL